MQITVGLPSQNEEAITCPKTDEELAEIFDRAYAKDPNSYTLAQVRAAMGGAKRGERVLECKARLSKGVRTSKITIAISDSRLEDDSETESEDPDSAGGWWIVD